MSEPGYPEPVCKGEWSLGTACGKCERCKLLLPGWLETRANSAQHAEIIKAIKSVEKCLRAVMFAMDPLKLYQLNCEQATRIDELEGAVKYIRMERDAALACVTELEKRVEALMRIEERLKNG